MYCLGMQILVIYYSLLYPSASDRWFGSNFCNHHLLVSMACPSVKCNLTPLLSYERYPLRGGEVCHSADEIYLLCGEVRPPPPVGVLPLT